MPAPRSEASDKATPSAIQIMVVFFIWAVDGLPAR